MSAKKVIKAIKSYSKFLISSHIGAEGDALGSELALVSLLRKVGKTAFIINSDSVPSNYSFLPGAKMIYPTFMKGDKVCHKLSNRNFQAAFIIDCPDKQRIGNVARLIGNKIPIINLDHHPDNKNFGKINWIDLKASSAGEMIYRLFRLTQTKLDRKDALNIYTAILTDTGSFRHSNATSAAFYISSKLLKFGIEPAKIYAKIYENNSVQSAAIVAKIISKMSFATNNKIAWVKISKDVFKVLKGKHEILDKILDFAKSINTVKVVIIFCQIDNRLVKLSLRSKSPINVQKIARLFGGGGHRFASGCVIKGSLKQTKELVLKEVKRIIRPI